MTSPTTPKPATSDVLDFEPQLVDDPDSPERSISWIVRWFYRHHIDDRSQADDVADRYLAAIRPLATIPAAEPVGYRCVHISTGKVDLRERPFDDLPFNREHWTVTPLYTSPPPALPATDAQIKHMVDRFLIWKLPETFNPDGGISFEKDTARKQGPVGTNLLDATQADAMVRHMIEGLPASPQPAREPDDRDAEIERLRTLTDRLRQEAEYSAGLISRLQAALMFWMPNVRDNDTPDNERAASDAHLLAGYEGEFPERCWGDETRALAAKRGEALKPFADIADIVDVETEGFSDDDTFDLMFVDDLFAQYTLKQFRAARSALTGEQP